MTSYEKFKYVASPMHLLEKSILIEVLGDYPSIRILNHLLIFREFDYSLTDIARESNVAWSTLNLLWPSLEKKGIVIHTRNVGKAKMYRLNTKSKVVQDLMKFADALVLDYAENGVEVEA